MTPRVDVVIPVYGHWELTERCLDALRRRDPCVDRVIVVDDASPDDTAARLRARDDVEAVVLARNGGFAAACNAGAARAGAEAIFFLNNDTLPEPGAIERLAETLADPSLAAVAPKLLNGDGTLQAAGLAMLAGQPKLQRLFTFLDADLREGCIAYAPIALSAAALLIRRAAFVAAGGFDEGYRNGYEDADLSLTLWSRGERLRYEPRAAIVHLEGASRGKALDDAANEARFAARWGARVGAIPRYAEPPAPNLDVRWRSLTPLEELVLATWRRLLRAHAGARVTVNAPLAARVLAPLDRRARLRVAHRAGGGADVVWCAPGDAREAAALARRPVSRFWCGTARAARLLHESGVAPERVAVTRLGFPATSDAAPRPLDRAAVVRRAATPAARAGEIAAALRAVPVTHVVAEHAGEREIAALRATPLVAFADDGDGWGLLGGTALAAGAVVVAPASAPFFETIPRERGVAVADPAALPEALRRVGAEWDRFAALGPAAARESARRVPELFAGGRIRALARAQTHGCVDPRALAIREEMLR